MTESAVSIRAVRKMGLPGYRQYLANPMNPMVLQYWRSMEHLEAYARQKDATHFPAWVRAQSSAK